MKQMGYDRASVVFSPEGRMYQVEYARKAVEKATTSVGVTFSNGIILAAARSVQKLLIPDNVEKIAKLDEHIGCVTCGILADGRVLVDYARVKCQINRMTYNEPIEVNLLAKDISDRKQKFTQIGGIRPYGISMLIAGTNETNHLFETDPSGTLREWQAHAIGRGSKDAKKYIVENFKEEMNKKEAIALTVKALKIGEKKISIKAIEIGIIENKKFTILDKNKVKNLLKGLV